MGYQGGYAASVFQPMFKVFNGGEVLSAVGRPPSDPDDATFLETWLNLTTGILDGLEWVN